MIALEPYHWLTAVALAALILWGAFWASAEATVARRLFLQFFVLAFLPLLVVLGGPLILLALVLEMDERVWQAVIAGVVLVAGWLTTAIFDRLGRARDKQERLRDTHKALFAEIRFALSVIDGDGEGGRWGAEVLRRMEADEGFVPFVPRERHDQIFDSVIGQIDVLPRQTIDPIVAYYGQIKAVSQMADDMRGDGFRALPQERRRAMYADYLTIRGRAFELGEYVLRLIDEYAKGGAAAADRLTREINSPGAGRSGRTRPGSE